MLKSVAYMDIVGPRPCLEYASVVWSPNTVSDINIIEAIQKRASRWICATWTHIHGTNLMMIELNWPTLALCRHCYMIDYIHGMLHE